MKPNKSKLNKSLGRLLDAMVIVLYACLTFASITETVQSLNGVLHDHVLTHIFSGLLTSAFFICITIYILSKLYRFIVVVKRNSKL